MLTVRKQPAAFVLLLLVALPLILSVGLFIKQKVLRYQREQRFVTELSQTVIVSVENISWIEEGKEILIDGNLFDVKSVKKAGKNLLLTGFFDNKEESIVKHIKDTEQQKNDSGSPLHQLSIKFLFLANYKEFTAFSIQNNWHFITAQFPVYAEAISNMAYPAIAPPPKFC
jgi:hypothetical protein